MSHAVRKVDPEHDSPSLPHSESLADRYFSLRNRLLSSPRFQSWAARFPLTRFVARRRASALFDLCAGFVYSQVLEAVVRLGLLEMLAEGPLTLVELAPRLSLSPEAAHRLLEAAAGLALVQRRGPERYGLGVHGASFIGNPQVGRMIEHHAMLYRDLADPVALLRGDRHETELRAFWSYSGRPGETSTAEAVAGYSELMASSLTLLAADILEAYPLDRHQRLLDVGGGEGVFLEAAATHALRLSLVLFDLPPVADRARERLGRAGLASRVECVGGDVFRDPLPEGADVVSLVRILHDHDDAHALRILRAARRALRPGGVLLVAEPMAGTLGAESVGAYFEFYLMAMGQGRPRTPERLHALMAQAGFGRVETLPTRRPILTRLVIGEVS